MLTTSEFQDLKILVSVKGQSFVFTFQWVLGLEEKAVSLAAYILHTCINVT